MRAHETCVRRAHTRRNFTALFGCGLALCCESYDSCFGRGTLVATPEGDVPIESLRVGDRVLSYDVAQRRVVVGEVTEVFEHVQQRTGTLRFAGASLRVTPNHPVYAGSGGGVAEAWDWTAAGHIQKGDTLVLLERTGSSSVTTEASALGFDETAFAFETVYNLTVSDHHNYFAGGVLVHNKSGPDNGSALCSRQAFPRAEAHLPTVCSGNVENTVEEGRRAFVVTTEAGVEGGLGGAGGGSSEHLGGATGLGGMGAGMEGGSQRAALSVSVEDIRCAGEANWLVSYYVTLVVPAMPWQLEVWSADEPCSPLERLTRAEGGGLESGMRGSLQLESPPPSSYWIVELSSPTGEPLSTSLWFERVMTGVPASENVTELR